MKTYFKEAAIVGVMFFILGVFTSPNAFATHSNLGNCLVGAGSGAYLGSHIGKGSGNTAAKIIGGLIGCGSNSRHHGNHNYHNSGYPPQNNGYATESYSCSS